MKLMLITNQPTVAKSAVCAGIERIFVDLELAGKVERQGHLDTVISGHTIDDVERIRRSVPGVELLVRVDGPQYYTSDTIDRLVDIGVNVVMLPMVRSVRQVEAFVKCVGRRTRTSVLVETPQALVRLNQIASVEGVDELYLGLNDMSIGLGVSFMFELLAAGLVDYAAQIARLHGKPFGFGGIARVGAGDLPAEFLIREHVRLQSSMVILSRSFHRDLDLVRDPTEELRTQVNLLRAVEQAANARNPYEVDADRVMIWDLIRGISYAREAE